MNEKEKWELFKHIHPRAKFSITRETFKYPKRKTIGGLEMTRRELKNLRKAMRNYFKGKHSASWGRMNQEINGG